MIGLLTALLVAAQAAPESTRWFHCVAAMPSEKIDYVTQVFESFDPNEGGTSFTRPVGWGAYTLAKLLDDAGSKHELPTCFRSMSRADAEAARARDIATWQGQGFTVKDVTLPPRVYQ